MDSNESYLKLLTLECHRACCFLQNTTYIIHINPHRVTDGFWQSFWILQRPTSTPCLACAFIRAHVKQEPWPRFASRAPPRVHLCRFQSSWNLHRPTGRRVPSSKMCLFHFYGFANLLAWWETTNQNYDHAQHVNLKNTALLPKRKRHLLATKYTVHICSHLVFTVFTNTRCTWRQSCFLQELCHSH